MFRTAQFPLFFHGSFIFFDRGNWDIHHGQEVYGKSNKKGGEARLESDPSIIAGDTDSLG